MELKAICACQPSRVAGEGTSLCRGSTAGEEVRLASAKASGVRSKVRVFRWFCQGMEGSKAPDGVSSRAEFTARSLTRDAIKRDSTRPRNGTSSDLFHVRRHASNEREVQLLAPDEMIRERDRYIAAIRRRCPGLPDPEEVLVTVLLKFTERQQWPVPEPYAWAAIVKAAVSALRRRTAEARKYQRLSIEFDPGHGARCSVLERRSA